jgi:DNA polymerase III subunit beta
MNITLTRPNLQKGLAAVSASIPSRTTLPVLSNILIETTDAGIRLSATDLDVSVRIIIPADVTQAGSITVPGKKLQEITRELPDQPVQLSSRGDQVEVKCGRAQFKLNGLPAEDFPDLPQVSFDTAWTVEGKDLLQLIQHTAFAVSTEESRPILNGVLWELRDGFMRMVATNGHRLARMTVSAGASNSTSDDLIVPPAALNQVQRLLQGEAEVRVARSGNHLGFHTSTAEIYTRLIEGVYPNYEQVIPKDNDRIAIADRKALEGSVRRMAVVASDQTHRIRMHLGNGRMTLNVLTPDLGEAHDELEIAYESEPMEIGFNAAYLLEVLRYIPGEEVKLTFKAPERAATVEPVGDGAPDYLCLVMPLRLLD